VTDTLPAGVTYLNAGGSGWTCGEAGGVVTCTRASLGVTAAPDITLTGVAPATAGVFTNTATVTSTSSSPTSPITAIATATVIAGADLILRKSDNPDPVSVGATLTYTLRLTNTGPSIATVITVTDTLPVGVTYLNAGGSGWTCSQTGGVITCTRPSLGVTTAPNIIITVTAPVTAGVITNTATVTSAVTDPAGPNTTVATTTVSAQADLTLGKSDKPDPVTVGEILTYTLRLTNTGPSRATTITVIDILPAGVTYLNAAGNGWTCSQVGGIVTCNRASLEVTTAPDIILTVIAPAMAGVITNTATAISGAADPETLNNTVIATTTVTALPIVSFSQPSYEVGEAEGTATITTRLSTPSALPVTVDYATSNGTAIAGSDYVAASGQLLFPPQTITRTFSVAITNDLTSEATETVRLTLSNPTNATLGATNPVTLTIVNDDASSRKVYLPVLLQDFRLPLKLSVKNETGGVLQYSIFGTPQGDIICPTTPNGNTLFCREFLSGRYETTATSTGPGCGSRTATLDFPAGVCTRIVRCGAPSVWQCD
jgi:uncharacterized repeat protein (TIGR01451 family)